MGARAGVPHELISLYPKSLAVVAPASAADHNRVTCVPKPGRWSRLGYPGSLGKSAGQTGTRVTLVTNCVTCVPNQDAGPGLASRLCRDKPAGLRPALLNKPNLLFFDLMQCAKVIKLTDLISGNVDTSKLFTCPTPQVCVESCPTANELGLRENPVCVDGVDTAPFQNLTFLDIPQAYLKLGEYIAQEKCAPYYITSKPVANRCIPTFVDLQDLINNTLNFNATGTPKNVSNYLTQVNLASILNGSVTQQLLLYSKQFLFAVYQDFTIVYPALLIGVGVALVLSFTYICLMRCLAGVVVWVGIISALLLIVFISGFCYYQFYCFENVQLTLPSAASGISLLSNVFNETVSVSQQICVTTSPLRQFIASTAPWFKYQKETWLALGIIGTVFLLVMVLILIFLGSKIRISVAIIKEASRAVGGIPTSIIYPVFSWILLVALFIYWAVVALFLLTSSTASFSVITNTSIASEFLNVTGLGVISNGMQCDPNSKTSAFSVAQTIFLPSNLSGNASVSCYFNSFVTSNFLLGLHVFHLFGLFWIGNFIVALGECTLAGAFASYYWAFKKPKDVPTFALIESFGRTVLFHSGSLAFGSLIIAIVQIARVILAYIQKKLKGKSGKVIKVLLCLLQCCFWLLEKVLRYVNRQAYIEIAIYGYDFCTGACKAIGLLLRNVITTAVKDRVVGLLLFMGKIFITAAVGVLAYLGFGPYVDGGSKLWGGKELNYFLIPVIALMVITYLIASSFMSVYHMAVDTIFICAMEDLERNNGFDKPYFMTKDLQNILGVKNKVQDRPDGTVEMQQTDGRDL
ncbi:hypothetical protein EMCRGX_G020386 [Ephydatia muelleri]